MKKWIFCCLSPLILFSCDDGPVSVPGGLGQESIYAVIEVSRKETMSLTTPIINGTVSSVTATLKRSNVSGPAITDAQVEVNGTGLVFNAFTNVFVAALPECTPGEYYKVRITVDNSTIVDSVRFPGNITINENGTDVSWEFEGNLDRALTMVAQVVWNSTGELTSPFTIPSEAFLPENRIYTVGVTCENWVNFGSSAFSSTSRIRALDQKFIDFQK